ncbi:hypothetical protein RCG23_25735 [Neobacillus sp. PS3-34]|uniref:hypothetical protein n=1 Tax=Neobacillus sp. PS3-34 TaxID=3070678 RepID=UPI0027DFFA39|nr:hypothetical protein [Neobacillus sp. PS3-34]WML48577.1 hypothetical protein RCG23_25735 [Neobacillus sp. PS3-34]
MKRVPYLWIGIIGTSILAIIFIFGPYLPNVDPKIKEHYHILGPGGNLDFILPPYPPSERFPLGSDSKGRDIYSALIIGTRETLLNVGAISLFTFLLAIPFGVGASHIRFLRTLLDGWNFLFARIPVFFFIVLLTTIPFFVFSHQRPFWMVTLIIVLELGKVAEFVRKTVTEIQQTTYYDAGIVSGTKIWGLWKWYYWPGCFSQWLSYFIQHMAMMLFLLGQLGFFSIYVSQRFEQIKGGVAHVFTMYGLVNTSIGWPTFLGRTFLDIYFCPWVPIEACIVITLTIFSFIALGKGILQYSLLKQKGMIYRKESGSIMDRFSFKFLFKKESEISK